MLDSNQCVGICWSINSKQKQNCYSVEIFENLSFAFLEPIGIYMMQGFVSDGMH